MGLRAECFEKFQRSSCGAVSAGIDPGKGGSHPDAVPESSRDRGGQDAALGLQASSLTDESNVDAVAHIRTIAD